MAKRRHHSPLRSIIMSPIHRPPCQAYKRETSVAKFDAQVRQSWELAEPVAQYEGWHFTRLATRLEELGSYYGALPAHDDLWDSEIATFNDLLARLAIEHCVHEARGLDVLPTTISRFRNGGVDTTADLLEKMIYPEEITHCAAGVKWFKFLCSRAKSSVPREHIQMTIQSDLDNIDEYIAKENDEVIQKFHETVRKYFRGPLKPPFNEVAQNTTGFGLEWYKPLAVKYELKG